MNKIEQNITDLNKVNPQTGLTATQEQCASLLAAGEKVSAVALKIQVSRTTIYQWKDMLTFQCYFNQLRDELKQQMTESLLGMTEEALTAIRNTLTSENEALKLKAATWLIDKIASVEVGQCNPFSIVKEQATFADDLNFGFTGPEFHKNVYDEKLKELGLKEA